jgi:hypothetical protein
MKGGSLVQCKMSARFAIVGAIFCQQMAQVTFAEHHDMVEVTRVGSIQLAVQHDGERGAVGRSRMPMVCGRKPCIMGLRFVPPARAKTRWTPPGQKPWLISLPGSSPAAHAGSRSGTRRQMLQRARTSVKCLASCPAHRRRLWYTLCCSSLQLGNPAINLPQCRPLPYWCLLNRHKPCRLYATMSGSRAMSGDRS